MRALPEGIPAAGTRYADGYTCHLESFDGSVWEFIVSSPDDDELRVMACLTPDGGWEHVGVKISDSPEYNHMLPTWDHMAAVKDLFWEHDECVVQYHPPAECYVNLDGGVLHLWRHRSRLFPIPDPRWV